MGQRIYDTAVNGEERVELIGGVDALRFGKQDEFFRVSLEIEFTFFGENLQLVQLGSLDDLGTGFLGVDSGI